MANIAPLNPKTKQRLITIADKYARSHYENVLHYLKEGQITLEEMPLLDNVPDVKQRLEDDLYAFRHAPDPQERIDWAQIESMIPQNEDFSLLDSYSIDSLVNALENYVGKYAVTQPGGNQVDRAYALLKTLSSARIENNWNSVDPLSYNSVLAFYERHKADLSKEMLDKVDDSLWDLVSQDDCAAVSKFMTDFPVSPKHLAEAKRIASSFSDWEIVKRSGDVFKVSEYIKNHQDSPFLEDANRLLYEYGKNFLADFKRNMNGPGLQKLAELEGVLSTKVFSLQDFIDAGIITQKGYDSLNRVKAGFLNPNVEYVDTGSQNISSPIGCTDVFLFGVPQTGKTCVTMGLLNSVLLNFDSKLFGGDAGLRLQQLCFEGYVASQTESTRANLITGQIKDESGKVTHPVNLIDMSGEDFAKKLAENPNADLSFENMGEGIPKMLNNDNEKIFLFVFDPNDDILYRTEKINGQNYRTEISQRQIFQKFCDILNKPENEKIMQKVSAIHFIAAKADMLTDERELRLEIARRRCLEFYEHSLAKLKDLCNKFNINVATDNNIMLFAFSLGKFYMGGTFEYDKTDSDTLLKAIAAISTGRKVEESMWRKFVKWCNQ